jgi:hypothetical protein
MAYLIANYICSPPPISALPSCLSLIILPHQALPCALDLGSLLLKLSLLPLYWILISICIHSAISPI